MLSLGHTIASVLIDITKADDITLNGFLIMLYSASSKRASEIGQAQIKSGHQKTMTAALSA